MIKCKYIFHFSLSFKQAKWSMILENDTQNVKAAIIYRYFYINNGLHDYYERFSAWKPKTDLKGE